MVIFGSTARNPRYPDRPQASPVAARRLAAPAKPAAAPAAAKGHGHGSSEPMSTQSLVTVFGIGALLFLVSDLIIFAKMGPLPDSFLAGLAVWVPYYLGQLLICVGVVGALRPEK